MWVRLGLLSYVAYLVHPALMMSFFYSRTESLFVDDWLLTLLFLGFFTST